LDAEVGDKDLELINLSKKFRKENLKVWIQYQPVKQGYCICMTEEIVEITAIEIRK